MKKFKLLYVALLTLLFALSMASCGSGDSAPAEETTAAPATEATTAAPANDMIVGVVTDATMNTVAIKTNDGESYMFATDGAELVYKNGIAVGNWVSILFTGDLAGTDTSDVTVVKIVDEDPNIEKEQKKVKVSSSSGTLYATSPVHVRQSYTTDSQILGTLSKGQSIERTGKSSNGWVRVDYKGKDGFVYSSYLSDKKPETAKKETSDHKHDNKGDKKTVTGTVVDATMGGMTVKIDGKKYDLYTAEAKHHYKDGVTIGDKVTIVYKGKLSDNPTIISISD